MPPALSQRVIWLFAVACGVSVANVYLAQPLLDSMAHDLAIDPAVIGIVMTLTQIGYALGLIFIVPLGDLIDRRRLILGQTVLSAIALAVVGLVQNAVVVLIALVAVGLLAVVVQVLVAFTATLAAPASRGRAVGTVTSGVVIGILLARVFAGALADFGGWRLVYLVSAGLMLSLAVLLNHAMPAHRQPRGAASYTALLRSTAMLFVEEPLLRLRATFALLTFAAMNVFWSSIVLLLSSPPWSLPHSAIGLLGLAGVAGALAASSAGRLADRGFATVVTGGALILMLASWAPLALAPSSMLALIVGVIVIDLAVQAVHVTNQSLIFAARPEAHSRLVGGYMVFYSIGSACGSISSTFIYARAGWYGVCALGAAISACALVLWVFTTLRRRRSTSECPGTPATAGN
ncbi:MFS transporter [Tardiphaga sp.]|uniref:MFS transporter n=1 Tax=Tardiphaga sp. TaxID=1926292 RepID=UPI00263A0ED8|nr:MFS transporter [Tardiphaga sp.]